MGCDKICVMSEGKIVAEGVHKQLINSCDIYKELYNSFKNYKIEEEKVQKDLNYDTSTLYEYRREYTRNFTKLNKEAAKNFEKIANSKLCNSEALYKELSKIIKKKQDKVYLFFDEIQEVENWEKCINSCRLDFDCDIYITGSNAKLLSGELATYLAGRYVEFIIYPFSFQEYFESKMKLFFINNENIILILKVIYGKKKCL